MKKDTPHILLINPWIHDFAAYDFWAKPLGLLSLGAILVHHGLNVAYIDCLDRFHPQAPKSNPQARYGRGPYLKTPIAKPEGLADIPRTYSRYGIKPEWFRNDLRAVDRPDLIMVTSLMTYWYPGVCETIEVIREFFPNTPILLGGIYATLCAEHAKTTVGADQVVTGTVEHNLLQLIASLTDYAPTPAFEPADINSYPFPAFNLQQRIGYIPILTSRGCPFACTYCASHFLHPQRELRQPDLIVEELLFWHEQYNVIDFAFYDDALLVGAEKHALPLFERILKLGLKLRFHTPNALHVREISEKTAQLMQRSGFTTLRLGLETAMFDHRHSLDHKVSKHDFSRAVQCLKAAGFRKNQIGAYLLCGLPGQSMDSVAASINCVKQAGITPIPAYYTPIPHTKLWHKAVAASRYDITGDPLLTNNAIMPCQKEPFSWNTISKLKAMVAA